MQPPKREAMRSNVVDPAEPSQIVHLYEAISVPSADALFLVLEYLPGGVLMNVQLDDSHGNESPFSLEQTREYFRQLVLGLEYLHANGVIHRDVSRRGCSGRTACDRPPGLTNASRSSLTTFSCPPTGRPSSCAISACPRCLSLRATTVSRSLEGARLSSARKVSPVGFSSCQCQISRFQASLIVAAHSNEVHGKAVDFWALGWCPLVLSKSTMH